MKVPGEVIGHLRERDNFFIASHFNPEGDALGSSIALGMALKARGKNVTVFNKDSVPESYEFLPGNDVITDSVPDSIENLLLLDCNSLDRAGLEKSEVKHAVVIDHHKTSNSFGDVQWVIPDAPATGLMIFYLIKELGVDISKDIASNLYTAIGIDTGIFRYPNTTSECLVVASELVIMGADPGLIAERLFNNYSKNRFMLLKEMLSGIEMVDGIAVTVVLDEMYRTTGTVSADTENFVNYPLLMDEVKVSMLLRQIGQKSWKVSLRSKGTIDISAVAAMFDGGGHRNAAGCSISGKLKDAKADLLKAVQDVIKQ
ncbi:MAG: bifunctional oligoribonuclease/PAP phosphatase NrnA [Nitrospirota bacterium]|nr:MAG: bifunctional oligoribonuclease/PAP phosphatase NrnA [Nitrospirota bacterium]